MTRKTKKTRTPSSSLSPRQLQELHPTTRYATEVVAGLRNHPVCRYEWLACERHLKDLKRVGDADFPYLFDESRADRIFQWFEQCCKHVRGPFAGQPIVLLAFQKFDLGVLYGWVHKDTGRRRFRRSYNKRARGNVKSTEMSGLTLYAMCGDCIYPPGHPELKRYETAPEGECAAVDKEQAKRVWLDAKAMGEASPDISKRLRIRRTYIEHATLGGWLRPCSKDTKNKDGGAPCLVVVDEYHKHPTSEIVDTLYNGLGKRAQGLMSIITTAGEDSENNPCYKEEAICKSILEGTIKDDQYCVVIRELDKDDNPHDQSLWVKANPILQVDNEYSRELRAQILDEYTKAYGTGDPTKIRAWLTKRCNLWQSDSDNKYMAGCMDKWKALAIPRKDFLELVKGRECHAGVDLSKRIDLTAAGFVFKLIYGDPPVSDEETEEPRKPTIRYAVCAHGFMPENTATKHEHGDRVEYKMWAKDGWCTLTPGDVTDDRYIREHIHQMEFDEQWQIVETCHDPYGARQLANEMTEEGYTCVEIAQTKAVLSDATKYFRELVLKGELVHDGSPLLTWCLANAVEEQDSGERIKLSKKHKDDSQRIDLAAAVINALARAMVYNGPGVLYFTVEGGPVDEPE